MKKKLAIIIVIIFTIINMNNLWAATYSLSKSSVSLNIGKTSKITLNGAGVIGGPFTISSSNPAIASVSCSSIEWVENSSASFTITAKSAGTATITVSGTVANANDSSDEDPVTKTVYVTVNEKTATSKKSNNANILSLSLDVEGLNPSFKKNVTSYKLNVDSNVEKLKLKVSLDNINATYRITGNKDFKEGENIVKIIVTAENKTTKTYKITVIKTPDLRLNTLNISNAEFVKEFDPDVYEYNLRDIESDIKKLNITAISVNDSAIIKIAGNDTLVTGENIIKIVVSDKNEEHSKVYTLKVNKLEKSLETLSDDAEIVEKNSYAEMLKDKIEIYKDKFGVYGNAIKLNATIILLYLLALIEFAQVIYLYKQLKNIDPSFDKIKIKKKETESKRIKRRKVNIDIDIDDKE